MRGGEVLGRGKVRWCAERGEVRMYVNMYPHSYSSSCESCTTSWSKNERVATAVRLWGHS